MQGTKLGCEVHEPETAGKKTSKLTKQLDIFRPAIPGPSSIRDMQKHSLFRLLPIITIQKKPENLFSTYIATV
jgi:hypothetical protein